MSKKERVEMSVEEAKQILPEGDFIHIMGNPGCGIISGTEWKREKVIELIEKNPDYLRFSGPMARGMRHGLAVGSEVERKIYYIETDENEIQKIEVI